MQMTEDVSGIRWHYVEEVDGSDRKNIDVGSDRTSSKTRGSGCGTE